MGELAAWLLSKLDEHGVLSYSAATALWCAGRGVPVLGTDRQQVRLAIHDLVRTGRATRMKLTSMKDRKPVTISCVSPLNMESLTTGQVARAEALHRNPFMDYRRG